MDRTRDDDDISSLGDNDLNGEGVDMDIDSIRELDMDDDELTEAKKRDNTEGYVLEISGFQCPEEYVNVLTPMEFEELVRMFMEYDVDGSRTIDKVFILATNILYMLFLNFYLYVLYSMKQGRFY